MLWSHGRQQYNPGAAPRNRFLILRKLFVVREFASLLFTFPKLRKYLLPLFLRLALRLCSPLSLTVDQ